MLTCRHDFADDAEMSTFLSTHAHMQTHTQASVHTLVCMHIRMATGSLLHVKFDLTADGMPLGSAVTDGGLTVASGAVRHCIGSAVHNGGLGAVADYDGLAVYDDGSMADGRWAGGRTLLRLLGLAQQLMDGAHVSKHESRHTSAHISKHASKHMSQHTAVRGRCVGRHEIIVQTVTAAL